jgi:hypothetical protein
MLPPSGFTLTWKEETSVKLHQFVVNVFVVCRFFWVLCFSTPRAHHSISPHKKKKKKKKKTTNINKITFDQSFLEFGDVLLPWI